MLNPNDFSHTLVDQVLSKETPVHFVGVGGIGMSGLARILCQAGFRVSGSDLRQNAQTEELMTLGAIIHQGHSAAALPEGMPILVVSTAIDATNPEFQEATRRGCVVMHRSQLLCEILQNPLFGVHQSMGVTGSHGKTSTTGMVASGLDKAGLQPTAIAGGVFPQWATNAVFGGEGALAVAELDESDGSLVHFSPDVTIFLNLEMDHAEHFPGGLDDLKKTLRQYVQQLIVAHQAGQPKTIVAYAGCQELADVLQPIVNSKTIRFVGVRRMDEPVYLNLPDDALWVTLNNCVEYRPSCYTGHVRFSDSDEPSWTLTMRAPGQHQCLNGAIALAACYAAHPTLDLTQIAAGISSFVGMGRRYEMVGEFKGAVLVDDYAHHPTEVAAMVAVGQQQVVGVGQFTAIFQPHRYTRLKQFWVEFMDSLQHADHVIVTDVYEASEPPIEGVSGADFTRELSKRYPSLSVRYVPHSQWDVLKSELQQSLSAHDVVMSLGAGDITYLLRDWPTSDSEEQVSSTETVVL